MSIQLQVAIPLFVTFLVLAGIAGLRRYFKPEVFVIGLAVMGLAVSMTVSYGTTAQAEAAEQEMEAAAAQDNAQFSVALANKYILDGQYEAAQEILSKLEISASSQLASARCSLLSGDYASAVQMYQQVSGADAECEQAVRLLASSQSNDEAMATYLKNQGLDPSDYGITANQLAAGDYQAAADLVREAVQKELDDYKDTCGNVTYKALEQTAKLNSSFESYLASGDEAELETVSQSLRSLASALEEQPSLSANVELRLARMKGYILTENYSQIAKKADRNTSAEELVVLAQLLVSDLVKKSDFGDSYVDRDVEPYQDVLKQCEQIIEDQESDLDSTTYKRYEQKVRNFKDQINNPLGFTLRQDLLDEAVNGDATMQSKCYLALAKLEDDSGNTEQAKQYITSALGTAANSDDQNYQIPMNKMTQIIQGSAQTSDIMNVAEYVDDALNHSLPLDIQMTDLNTESAEGGDLSGTMTETVKTSTATINIGVIDKDEFPVVKAKVQIQSQTWQTVDELKAHLKVYDCGSRITDFTLEKVEYQTSRIILLCDCSGSMSGSVSTLRQVIRDFADTMGEGEEVCVVGFNSSISFIKEFSGDKTVVSGYADSVFASGGTALFSSLLEAGKLHTQDINSNNIIIAMTDGQDGDWVGEADMYNQIGTLAAEKGLTVYTVGLGSVDAEYLELMASCGNGSFLYAKDEEELQAFYSFIHGQLNNQYILTYTAKNQTRNERTLELSVDEELGSAKKTYYLQDPVYSNDGTDAYDPYVVEDTDVTVNGLTAKFLYKSSQNQTVLLKGSGFDAGDDVTVRLIGNVKYDLAATYVDSNTYSVVIPADIASGTFDLEVCVADSSVTLEKELTVAVQGSMKQFIYGSYRFTALESHVDSNGKTVLSGNVTMNGWLRFKGDVTIDYNYYNKSKALVTDESGFYVSYSPDMSSGLASFMAEHGVMLSFDALGTFTIYPDTYTPGDYDNFPVEEKTYGKMLNLLMFVCDNFSIAVYPDMLRLQGMNFTFKLPFQEQLMRNWKQIPSKAVEFDSDCLVSATRVGLQGTLKYEDMDKEDGFVLVSLPLKMKKLDIQIDTLKNDYSLSAAVGFKALDDAEGFELSVGVVGGRLDSFGLRQDMFDIPVVTAPVPVTINDFGFEISELSKLPDDAGFWNYVLDTNIAIIFNVDAANLNQYAPKIAKLVDKNGNVALAQFKDCKLQAKLRELRFSFEADVVLATVLELGHVEINLGNFKYSNRLIGFYDVDAVGLRIASRLDLLKWNSANLTLELNGTRELCFGYPYSGLWYSGEANFEVDWWLGSWDWGVTGDAMIGAFENSMGNFQFSVILRGENKDGDLSGFHAYVTSVSGFNVYKY